MSSTYTTRGRLEKQGDGENDTTWGQKANTVFDLVDEWLGGYLGKSVAGSSDVTLTANNGTSDESRQRVIEFTGLLTGNINVIVPTAENAWLFKNNTTGAFTLTVKTTAGTGITITQGKWATLYCDGTNVLQGPDLDTLMGTVATAGIEDAAVTYAKLQDVSATARILGRKTGGSGDAEECTLSEILDFIGSAAQGDVLYRGAASWARLAAGTNGQVLTTGGTGANPAWATPAASSDEKTKVSSNDTTAGYLNGKLVAGSGITLTENSDGSNETLTIAGSAGTVSMQKFIYTGSAQTWTKPSGVKYVRVVCVGGGGGGGGSGNSANGSGGGGGGGGYSEKIVNVESISSETVTIGAAGAAGVASPAGAGGNGGDTSFGAHCIGKGGGGGGSDGSPNAGAGGVAGTGDVTVVGQNGDNGSGGSTATTFLLSGAGGNAAMGFGHGGRASPIETAAEAGTGYGGGGASGVDSDGSGRAGAAGSAGICIVYEFK